jgi:hypothetical protein
MLGVICGMRDQNNRGNSLFDIFSDTLIDSIKVIPFLLVIFIGTEILEYKYAKKISKAVQKAGAAGPAIGAITGSFPQCGLSVVASVVHMQRLVTIGTLLVFIFNFR